MKNESTNLVRYEPAWAKPVSEEFRREIEHSEMPDLPSEAWEKGLRFHDVYRLLQKGVRLDDDVLAWLKAGGPGHGERANQILRERMLAEQREMQG